MTGQIEAALYAADGSTFIDLIRGAVSPQWLDEINATGFGSVRIPLTDAAVAVADYDQVIKFGYAGGDRFACVVEQPAWGVVDESGKRYLELSGRGLLMWLEAAGLLPASGTVEFSTPDQRWFNFAAADSFAHDLHATWATPAAVKWSSRTTGPLAGYPKDWPDRDAYWIWSIDPLTPTTSGSVNWFRKQFTLSADAVCRLYVTADDFVDARVDGALVFSEAEEFYWKRTGTVDVTLTAGTHVLALRGGNTPRVFAVNTASVIASLVTLDASGNPDATIVHTDGTWQVATTEPYWTAGDVLHTVVTEAQAFGWGHLAALTLDFTAAVDSNGAAWSTKAPARSWDIVTTNLLTIASDLAALGIDIWITPDLVMHAAESRGSVKDVTLTPASTVAGWKIQGRRATGTYGWVRTDLGWVPVQDTAGVAAHGKIAVGLHVGMSDSDDTAAQVAAAAFAVTAAPLETVTDTTVAPSAGATAYVDFDVADTVNGLDKTGAVKAQRLLSLTVAQDSDGNVTYRPELEG